MPQDKIDIVVEAKVKDALEQLGLLEKQPKKVENSFKQFFTSTKAGFAVFTSILGGVVVKTLTSFLKKAGDIEQTNIAFKTFLGSAELAKKKIAELNKFSAVTPFTSDQVLQAGKALLAFGIDADQLVPKLKQIGDLSAGTGKDFNELAVIFGKARVQGTLFAEDINQLTEAGIPVIDEFAKILGVSTGEVKKLGSEGKINFQILEQAFDNLTGAGGKFFNLTQAQSESFLGIVSTLQSNLELLAARIGNSLIPIVKPFVVKLNEMLDTTGGLDSATKLLVSTQAEYNDVVKRLDGSVGKLNETERTNLEIRKAQLSLDLQKQISALAKKQGDYNLTLQEATDIINSQNKGVQDYITGIQKLEKGQSAIIKDVQSGLNIQYNPKDINLARKNLIALQNVVNKNKEDMIKYSSDLDSALSTMANGLINGVITLEQLTPLNTKFVKQVLERKKAIEAELKIAVEKKDTSISASQDEIKQKQYETQEKEKLTKQAFLLDIGSIEELKNYTIEELQTLVEARKNENQERKKLIDEIVEYGKYKESDLSGYTIDKLKETLDKEKDISTAKQSLYNGLFDALSQAAAAFFDTMKSYRDADLEQALENIEAEKDAKVEELEASNEYTDQLAALDEEEKQAKILKLQEELAAAIAAGDTELAKEKENSLKRIELETLEAAKNKEISQQVQDAETEYNKKVKEEKTAAAEADKEWALAQVAINTAGAIVKALVDPGGIAGGILSVAAGVTGAVQAAAIAAEPIPAFAQGGIVPDDSMAMVNRREMILPVELSDFIRSAASNASTQNYDNKTVNINFPNSDPFEVISIMEKRGGLNILSR